MQPGSSRGLSCEAEEEVQALAAIYGNQWARVGTATYQLAVEGPRGCAPVHVVFTLPHSYPEKDGPIFEVVAPTWWPASATATLAAEFAATMQRRHMQGSPVLFECAQCVHDHVAAMTFPTSQAEDPSNEDHGATQVDGGAGEEGLCAPARANGDAEGAKEGWQAEVHTLDHMNDRAGYSKKLVGYAAGCGLVGRLLFYAHHIVVLLAGPARGLREWRRLMRTSNVDVDRARGKPCRERMMAMVCAGPFTGPGYEGFGVQVCAGPDEVQAALARCGLASAYAQLGLR